MSAREEMLSRIRKATADVETADPALDVPVHWTYGRALDTADVLADFVPGAALTCLRHLERPSLATFATQERSDDVVGKRQIL